MIARYTSKRINILHRMHMLQGDVRDPSLEREREHRRNLILAVRRLLVVVRCV